MTKAAVRAMDVVSEFTADSTAVKIEEFVVAGGSKRVLDNMDNSCG
jgi:PhoPQ-activated pathogenicity-related protein